MAATEHRVLGWDRRSGKSRGEARGGMASLEHTLSLSINAASIGCGLLVVLMIVAGSVANRALVDRVSLRLTLAISAVDVGKATAMLLYSHADGDTFGCAMISFAIQWFTLVYLLLNSAILLNIQLICFHGIAFKRGMELAYWVVCFSLPTLLLLPPLGNFVHASNLQLLAAWATTTRPGGASTRTPRRLPPSCGCGAASCSGWR